MSVRGFTNKAYMPFSRSNTNERPRSKCSSPSLSPGSDICHIASHISCTSPDVLPTNSRMRSNRGLSSLRLPVANLSLANEKKSSSGMVPTSKTAADL